MPFRSEKQRRYLWKNHPKIAKDWTDEYGSKPQPTKKAEGRSVKKTDPQTRLKAYALANANKNKDRLTQADIKRAKNALKGTKEALKIIKKKPELVGKGKSPSYLTGKEKAKEHREKLKKLLKKGKGYVDEWMGKKKGGRVKKNGPVRPIHIPWDSQKKKKGGIMEPYRGSYISGKVDGKMLSNPSLRKYYKGLI